MHSTDDIEKLRKYIFTRMYSIDNTHGEYVYNFNIMMLDLNSLLITPSVYADAPLFDVIDTIRFSVSALRARVEDEITLIEIGKSRWIFGRDSVAEHSSRRDLLIEALYIFQRALDEVTSSIIENSDIGNSDIENSDIENSDIENSGRE